MKKLEEKPVHEIESTQRSSTTKYMTPTFYKNLNINEKKNGYNT